MFIDDLDIPGVLQGITIRSPVAGGRLAGIDCPPLPPGYVLVRAGDIPGENSLGEFPVPVLAAGELRYIGEPAALLIGPEKRKLEELAAACAVLTEPDTSPPSPEGGDFARLDVIRGNPEKCFAEARTVVEGRYRTGIQDHWYSEPAGALAEWSPGTKSRMVVHTGTQWAFQVRRSVAAVLGLPPNQVLVEPGSLGMHLDGKLWYPALLACHAALGALATGRPVKIMLSREEDFLYSPKRFPSEVRIKSALGEGGKLLAQKISLVCDLGAYGVFAEEILDQACLGALGPYRQGVFQLEGRAARSGIPPAGPFVGFGLAQGFFAMERHAGRIAETLGQNPLEWRRDNALFKKKTLAAGVPLPEDPHIEKLLDTAAAMGDFHRKWAAYETLRRSRRGPPERGETLRGIGIAAGYQTSGFLNTGIDRGVYSVELTLDKNSELAIRTSMASSSSEYAAIWRLLASEILSIERGAVRVVSGGTDDSPDSGPAALSRNITTVTRLVELACQAIRKQRFRDPLPITVRRSTKPARIPGWDQAPPAEAPSGEEAPAKSAGNRAARQIDQNAFAHMGFGAAVVEVEIDPIEYGPRVRGVWIGLNGGKILSQKQAWRSVRHSVVQALGWASREDLSYLEGRIPESRFARYDITDPEEVPPIYIDFIWNDATPPNGIDELAFACVPAAYAQALSQATDHPFDRIPVTARDIWNTLKGRDSSQGGDAPFEGGPARPGEGEESP